MKHYATFAATTAALLSLGFIQHEDAPHFFDSPKEDSYGMPVVQAYVYECSAGYHCVDLDGCAEYSAPVVWNGPRAEWDTSNSLEDFVAWLDKYYSGWR